MTQEEAAAVELTGLTLQQLGAADTDDLKELFEEKNIKGSNKILIKAALKKIKPAPPGLLTLPALEVMDHSDHAMPPQLDFVGVPPSSRKVGHLPVDGIMLWDFTKEVLAWDASQHVSGTLQLPLFDPNYQSRPRVRQESDLVYFTRCVLEVVGHLMPNKFSFSGEVPQGNLGRLDFAAFYEGQAIFVLESKKKGFIPDHSPLAELAEKGRQPGSPARAYTTEENQIDGHQRAALGALQQLNGYLYSCNPSPAATTYGVISTYFDFWFVRRHGSNLVEVSPPFALKSTEPTLLRALAFMLSQSLNAFIQHPPVSAPVANEGGKGDEWGGEEGDEGDGDERKKPSAKRRKQMPGGSSTSHSPQTSQMRLCPSLGIGRTGPVALMKSRFGPAALKFAPTNSGFRSELQHEVDIYGHLASLQGRYIPKLFHGGPLSHGYLGLLLQYVGLNLAQTLAVTQRKHDSRNLKLAALSSLRQVHAAGVLHQDIRLENFCVRRDNTVVVIDFGFATLCTAEVEHQRECLQLVRLF